MSFAHSNRSRWRMISGAVSGMNCSSLRSSNFQRAMVAHRKVLRSLAGKHQSCQPAAGATQAVTPAADLPSSCHYAKDKGNIC